MFATGRTNQKRRTRSALVTAALQLLRAGRSPTIGEVAQAALVSQATAYRYFPSTAALWAAVLIESGEPVASEVFSGLEQADTEARVDALVRSVAFRMFEDEALWRTAARLLHERAPIAGANGDGSMERIPVLTGQRLRWIEQALQPGARKLSKAAHRRLSMSLALVVGVEALTTLRDVCQLPQDEAKQVMLWASRALVHAAVADSTTPKAAARPRRPSR